MEAGSGSLLLSFQGDYPAKETRLSVEKGRIAAQFIERTGEVS
jgi:hypothetical protein